MAIQVATICTTAPVWGLGFRGLGLKGNIAQIPIRATKACILRGSKSARAVPLAACYTLNLTILDILES